MMGLAIAAVFSRVGQPGSARLSGSAVGPALGTRIVAERSAEHGGELGTASTIVTSSLPVEGRTWMQRTFELPTSGSAPRNLPMEGLRALAVTLVFFVHYHALFRTWLPA